MRRYTLVFHYYYGYGGYAIEFKRVRCTPQKLAEYKEGDLHFVMSGWPKIHYPTGEDIEYRK